MARDGVDDADDVLDDEAAEVDDEAEIDEPGEDEEPPGFEGTAEEDDFSDPADVDGVLESNIDEVQEASDSASESRREVEAWAQQFDTRSPRGSGENRNYQIRQCGHEEIHVAGGGQEVWADGIDADNRLLLDAKCVGNPDQSPFVQDSALDPDIRDIINAKTEDEMYRYGSIINDQNTPVDGLEIRTNELRAAPYFQELLDRHGIQGKVSIRA